MIQLPQVARRFPPTKYCLRKLFRYYVRVISWLSVGHQYKTRIDPFQLLHVDPLKIKKLTTSEARNHFAQRDSIPEVVGGNWDEKVSDLSEYTLYIAIHERYNCGVDWEDTEFFAIQAELIESGQTKFGVSSTSEFRKRLSKLDKIIEDIETNGYRTQVQLEKEGTLLDNHIPSLRPPELHEVTVNIARDGELILHEGRHRLSIAHLLELEEIPVRVKVRHEEWMAHRDRKLSSGNASKHPDLCAI